MLVRNFVRIEMTSRHCHVWHQSSGGISRAAADSGCRQFLQTVTPAGSADDGTAVSRLAKLTRQRSRCVRVSANLFNSNNGPNLCF